MGTRGLVLSWVVEGARFVEAHGAKRVEDVVKNVVFADVGVVLIEAAGEVVHAVGGAERQLLALGVDEVVALGRVDGLVGHLDGAAGSGLVGGRIASVEIVPGIVADVVGALGLVDTQKVDGAVGVGEGDADVVAVDGHGPVGDAIGVDFAAQHADGRREAGMGRDPDCLGLGCSGVGQDGEEKRDEERERDPERETETGPERERRS